MNILKQSISCSLLSLVFLAACSDMGNRDNPFDMNGDEYEAYWDFDCVHNSSYCDDVDDIGSSTSGKRELDVSFELSSSSRSVLDISVAEHSSSSVIVIVSDPMSSSSSTVLIIDPVSSSLDNSQLFDDIPSEQCVEFGQIAYGKINQNNAYFCYENEWKRFYGNTSITYEKMEDDRDGKIYRVVKIGEQTWMAENLKYLDKTGFARYMDSLYRDSVEIYGITYEWESAIDSAFWNKQGKNCDKYKTCILPSKVQGICPNGWKLPSNKDWTTLFAFMEDSPEAMQAKGFNAWSKAEDMYGFSLLPAGGADVGTAYSSVEFSGVDSYNFITLWSYPEEETFIGGTYTWDVTGTQAKLNINDQAIYPAFIRCIKDVVTE